MGDRSRSSERKVVHGNFCGQLHNCNRRIHQYGLWNNYRGQESLRNRILILQQVILYVANQGSNSVSMVNTFTGSVVGSIAVGSAPFGITFDSTNGFLYVTNTASNTVSEIDGSSNSVVGTVGVGTSPVGLSFDTANGNLYVANKMSGSVSIVPVSPPVTTTTTQVRPQLLPRPPLKPPQRRNPPLIILSRL